MLYYCHLISLSPICATLFREERWERSCKGHRWNTSSAERPRFCSAAANETGSTLSLRRFLHLRRHKTQAGCKCRSNTGELTSANSSYSRVHSESASMKGWKSILLLTNESMPLQVKSGNYIILHCDSKHNVKDY